MKKPAYYQPILSNVEWESGKLASFMVYKHYENAKRDYPHHTIGAYEEGDIEEPTFVDENYKLTIIEKIKAIIANWGEFGIGEVDGADGICLNEMGSMVALAENFTYDNVGVEVYEPSGFSSDSVDSYTEEYENLSEEDLEAILVVAELYDVEQEKTYKRIADE
jgi:hypothetical protein